ncbi:phage tail protein [Salmonella enterica]|uniref:phage tail-collar fiber domain-containing protein n=1 Tax=Salmonella enterica TaxID=28901 RepID=UPI003D319CDB
MPASPKFKTIITDYGKQRLIAAMSPGGTKLTLTQMAVGDGGGNPTNPDTTNTTLINEVWRAAVNSVSVDKKHSNIIIVELLIPAEVGGFWIREAGIYDEFNKLVAICSLPASEKPLLEQGSGRAQTVRMTLVISDLSTINITIDSTTIIATNDYVDNSLKEHEKSRNHPDATLTDKGFTKLYSGVASPDETMAATPKAVKIAMDNASARLAKERNLADLTNVPLARQSLQLGDSATRNVGTTQGTVAAGDDSRITGAMQKDQNGADIPDKPGFIKNVGLKETVNQAAGAMQKSQNGADIPDTALFRQSIGVYDASTSQKGLVRLNGGVSDADDTLGATSGAVKIAYDAAQSAYRLALSKYTADGATTGKAGLVQLVNLMGGSNSLVMPQAAVTTAIQNYPSLGKGQTLQDLRGSRSIDATYTNSTGFPIAVYVRISGGYSANLYAHVNGIEFGGGGSTASNTSIATAFFIVPNGATYRVMASGASPALQMWSELR